MDQKPYPIVDISFCSLHLQADLVLTDLKLFPTPLLSSFTIEAGKGFLKILFPVSSAKSGDHWYIVLPKWKSAETVSQKISLCKVTGTNLVGTGPPLLVLAAKEDEPRVIATIL